MYVNLKALIVLFVVISAPFFWLLEQKNKIQAKKNPHGVESLRFQVAQARKSSAKAFAQYGKNSDQYLKALELIAVLESALSKAERDSPLNQQVQNFLQETKSQMSQTEHMLRQSYESQGKPPWDPPSPK